ncbi:response regulator [Plantactinospora solaniradicis]|uniref:Response regulator n=1 Tax=Plantactinospora solaniradicis TaxID=1723736 RepID=A0ABW1K968_9ACTN
MEKRIRVLVIDDHPVVRSGVISWLTEPGSNIEVAATGDTLAAVYLQPGSDADVIVLDLELADGRVSAAKVGDLVAAGRRIVILTQHTDPATIRSLLDVGVHAVLSKMEGPQFCRDAVRAAAGQQYSMGPLSAAAIVTDERVGRPRLSQREREALQLRSYGLSREEIADIMGVKMESVKTYLKRAGAKYAQRGRATSARQDLTVRALEDGIVTVAELSTQIDRRHTQ